MLRSVTLAALTLLFATLLHVPARAASVEEAFSQARQAYEAGKLDEAAALFTETAELLLEAGQTAKAQAILGNAAICHMKGENWSSAADVYELILGMPGKTPPDVLLKSYNNLVVCLDKLGRPALKTEALERMLKALPKLPPSELSDIYARLGDAYRAMELYARAEANYSKAEQRLSADVDPVVIGRILTAKGLCQGNLGDFDKASQSLGKAGKIAGVAREPLTLAESASNLGVLHWERGDYAEALALLKTSLDIEEQNRLRRNEGVDRNNLGLVQKSMGRMTEAMVFFEEALNIAREVKNKKDEAIALSNRALLYRIAGNLTEARTGYREALSLYEDLGFQEGRAGTLMGLAKIAELEDRDLSAALTGYREALEIYTRLEMPRGQAEALLQVGGVLKKILQPGRASRDLVYEEAPVNAETSKENSLEQCREAYSRALELAEAIGSKEMIWAARQGMGFVLRQEGNLEKSMEQYMQAIDMVTAMRVSLRNVELLGEYMAGKEDLYEEAMEVCARLFEKNNDPKYLSLQMRLGETLRNEVQKAGAALVQLNFSDSKKQALYGDIMRLGRRQALAEAAVPTVAALPATPDAEAKARHELRKQEAGQQKAAVKKLDQDYKKLLDEWKKKYPGDAVVFESGSRVNIPDVQKALKPDQVLLQYLSLPDHLVIMAVSKDSVDCVTSEAPRKELTELIKKDFLVRYIEEYGHMSAPTQAQEEEYLNTSLKILAQLHQWLISPVSASLEGKKRLYVVTDGFLSQVPFGALVTAMDNNTPTFLVEKYDISYVRPSFIAALTKAKSKESIKTLLAVGNPRNAKLTLLAPLDGAEKEVSEANASIKRADSFKDVKYQKEATEEWLKDNLAKSKYEFVYFATHGMPHSETYYKFIIKMGKSLENLKKKQEQNPDPKLAAKIEKFSSERRFIEDRIPGLSPLNGFLYMGESTDNSEDGLLTIKEIMEIPESSFTSTRYVLLSACNTGVTFAPATLEDGVMEDKFSIQDIEKDLRKTGWVPGLDQISFVDVFMRRGISNVYGTLWFASDESSQYLMSNFMKRLMDQGDAQDAVVAFSDTQRGYIAACKADQKPLGSGYPVPLNPYFWAVGAMFGR